MGTFDGIGSLAGRLIRQAARKARRQVGRTEDAVQHAKTAAATRRRMMDAALRERRAKRGK